MKIKKKKGVDGKLDAAWSKLVKLRGGNKCEYCQATNKQIHSHHIYTRASKSTRWDVLNGISLCAYHHVLSHQFSAHQTPIEFAEWLYDYKGKDFMTRIRVKSKSISKIGIFEKKLLLSELNKEIDSYQLE